MFAVLLLLPFINCKENSDFNGSFYITKDGYYKCPKKTTINLNEENRTWSIPQGYFAAGKCHFTIQIPENFYLRVKYKTDYWTTILDRFGTKFPAETEKGMYMPRTVFLPPPFAILIINKYSSYPTFNLKTTFKLVEFDPFNKTKEVIFDNYYIGKFAKRKTFRITSNSGSKFNFQFNDPYNEYYEEDFFVYKENRTQPIGLLSKMTDSSFSELTIRRTGYNRNHNNRNTLTFYMKTDRDGPFVMIDDIKKETIFTLDTDKNKTFITFINKNCNNRYYIYDYDYSADIKLHVFDGFPPKNADSLNFEYSLDSSNILGKHIEFTSNWCTKTLVLLRGRLSFAVTKNMIISQEKGKIENYFDKEFIEGTIIGPYEYNIFQFIWEHGYNNNFTIRTSQGLRDSFTRNDGFTIGNVKWFHFTLSGVSTLSYKIINGEDDIEFTQTGINQPTYGSIYDYFWFDY